MIKTPELLIFSSKIGTVGSNKNTEAAAEPPFNTWLWKASKVVFYCLFVGCTICTHFWAVAYGFYLKQTKSMGTWFFFIRSVLLAATMDDLFLHRKSVSSTISRIIANTNQKASAIHLKMKILLAFVNICFVCYVVVGTVSFFQTEENRHNQTSEVLLFGYSESLSRNVKFFILALDNFLFRMHAALLVLWFPFVYGITVANVLQQVRSLKDVATRRETFLSLEMMLEEMGRALGRIRKLVKEINQCLGGTVFVWCGSALIAVCEGISHMLSDRRPLMTLQFFSDIFIFFVPTLTVITLSVGVCSKVTSEMEATAELLHDLSDTANREGLASRLHLLLYRMSVPELVMTGAGYCTINRQFALSYICLVISYSAFISQLPQ